MEAIKEEIFFRRLDPGIIKAVDIQNNEMTIEELNGYCEAIRNFYCPICNKEAILTAAMISHTVSVIVLTFQKSKLLIGCSSCLKKENDTALLTTLVFGWWGFPHGIIKSVRSINTFIRSKKAIKQEDVNDYLRIFVRAHIGLIKMYEGDSDRLFNIMINQNKGISSSANNI